MSPQYIRSGLSSRPARLNITAKLRNVGVERRNKMACAVRAPDEARFVKSIGRQTEMALGLVLAAIIAGSGCVGIRMPDPNVRFVAVGDSTTAGASQRDYPDILREQLGEPRGTFVNEGHGGETTEEGLVRLKALLEDQMYPGAEVWFYWEGGNDIIEFVQAFDPLLSFSPNDVDYPFAISLTTRLDKIRGSIETAIATLRNAGMQVYVATLFPIRAETSGCPPMPGDIMSEQQAGNANALIVRLNDSIRTAVADGGAVLVDIAQIGGELQSDPANYADCNHLSALGNEIVAAMFVEVIRAQTSP